MCQEAFSLDLVDPSVYQIVPLFRGSHTYRVELEPSLYHGDAPDAVFVVGASPPQSVGVYRTVAVPAVIASLARSKRR